MNVFNSLFTFTFTFILILSILDFLISLKLKVLKDLKKLFCIIRNIKLSSFKK